MVVRNRGELVADIPAKKLADEAPVYQREAQEPEYLKARPRFRLAGLPDHAGSGGALSRSCWPGRRSPQKTGSIANTTTWFGTARRFARARMPPSSGSRRIPCPFVASASPAEASKPIEKYIALSVDCNAAYVFLDPYEGSKIAVAEAARNLACSGAAPLGVTDNLNFGNPHNPEIFWQLREAVRGLAEACRAFNAPVTGGNVSLYNQSPGGPIDPTPTVAMAGIIDDAAAHYDSMVQGRRGRHHPAGESVDLKDPLQGLGGSACLHQIHGLKTGMPPRCDLESEKDLHLALRALIHSGVVKSAHDCSEGGLAVALAESCISQQIARETPRLIGAEIDLADALGALEGPPPANGAAPASAPRLDALLFGETQARVVITTAALDVIKVVERAKLLGVPAVWIGTVGGDSLRIRTPSTEFSWAVGELHDAWWNSIARAMTA